MEEMTLLPLQNVLIIALANQNSCGDNFTRYSDKCHWCGSNSFSCNNGYFCRTKPGLLRLY